MRKPYQVVIAVSLGMSGFCFSGKSLAASTASQTSVVDACIEDQHASFDVCWQAVSLKPKDYRLWNNLGTKITSNEDQPIALAYFNKAIELNPVAPVVYYNRANTFMKMGKVEAALHDYDAAISLSPSDRLLYEIYISRGDLYLSSLSLPRAQEDFIRAQRLFPNNPKTYTFLGKYEDQRGHRETAIGYYSKAIDLGSWDARIYVNRGLLYTELNEFSEAEQDMNRAVELAPAEPWGYYGLGIIYRDKNQPDKALEFFMKADQFSDEQFEVPYNIAQIFWNRNQFDKTLAYINRAIKLNPSYGESYYMRGAAYTILKQCPAANLDFKKACELGLTKACKESCKPEDRSGERPP